ncbi:bacterio-opsin activator domain-containing protein [Halococcus saccharolyticus]|uniref:Bacterio-opsin activator-like protein n=1 Tax=Halococcus saccharolyticus DSM 5350 TaxID=1227455 RepID=M0MTN1_9EURY|nr:bacterio-opsin activator domain-containing protein [Halococcus saccharolyticus]EMA47830.1 bacterio-opsin activator-like protein [Halococcus saccharolyticus DSM 5350]
MDGLAQFLCTGGYERLRRATRTHRGDLVVRLCGEVGLQPSEVVAISPADVRQTGTTRLLDVGDREAFVPAAVAHSIQKYAQSVDDTDPLVDVSERRIQMLVSESGTRAADATGDNRFRDVSTRNLRAAHARQLLHDGVDARIVLAVTAYERVAALEPYLPTPDRETVAAALSGKSALTADGLPAWLRRAVRVVADVGEELMVATSASDIHETVCGRLADTDGYRFAWIAETTGDGLTVRAHAGVAANSVDQMLADRSDLVTDVVEEQTIRTVDVGDTTLLAVPLAGEMTRGLLGIGTLREDVDAIERDLLGALGAQVGHALAVIEHRRLLLADTVTELTFDIGREAAFLPETAATLDCEFELVGIVPADEGVLCYVTTRAVTPDAVFERASTTDEVSDVRFVSDDETGMLLELMLRRSPIRTFAKLGGQIRSYEVGSQGGQLVGETPTDANVRSIVETMTDTFPTAHLTAKRETEPETATDGRFRETLTDDLTERQTAALRSAYFGGYFEWPRDSTAEELADSLSVSSPTLHHHLRIAQKKLLQSFFHDSG